MKFVPRNVERDVGKCNKCEEKRKARHEMYTFLANNIDVFILTYK